MQKKETVKQLPKKLFCLAVVGKICTVPKWLRHHIPRKSSLLPPERDSRD